MDMQSVEPVTQSSYKKSLCSDKNCQSTRCYKKKYPVRSVCNDRNCLSTVCSDNNCQTHMWSVTKPSYMQLAKLAIIQSCYKKSLGNDKNCQSAKPMLCYDKNVKWSQKRHNLLICGQCQGLLTTRLVHSLKYLGTVQILQARAVTQKCLQFQEITRNNLLIVILAVPRCNLHRRDQWT